MEKHRKNNERLKEIYDKALDLFAKNGYDATSMSMIAEVLGTSKPNLYHYCSSKEDLLYRIHLDLLQNNFIPILDEVEDVTDPRERLTTFFRKFTLMATSSPASGLLVHELRSLNQKHQNEIKCIWKRSYKIINDSIKELQQSGKARKGRASFLSFLGAGMVFWINYWFDYSRQINAEELADTLNQVFLNGLLLPDSAND
ncbi:TetR family transcriptional regulator [Desulfosarcina ovata subsp. sediminis]|uniref:TetR family transcriptional regulator n=1 Tax=Desulfosarcina ovata subsp. sediminis TaxID=885957 RepID=A0A5K7ZMF4_9BACT|nr:TetR/AcrR family transcriptional regulator [Desulfosarcina ovata]BBO80799.1 TetR family transcriptional regulator [Desulfosarcina ovata subsp. sediminis]